MIESLRQKLIDTKQCSSTSELKHSYLKPLLIKIYNLNEETTIIYGDIHLTIKDVMIDFGIATPITPEDLEVIKSLPSNLEALLEIAGKLISEYVRYRATFWRRAQIAQLKAAISSKKAGIEASKACTQLLQYLRDHEHPSYPQKQAEFNKIKGQENSHEILAKLDGAGIARLECLAIDIKDLHRQLIRICGPKAARSPLRPLPAEDIGARAHARQNPSTMTRRGSRLLPESSRPKRMRTTLR